MAPNPLGLYDMQYAERTAPECRGRLRTDGEGKYGFRAIVPVSYAIPDDVGPNSFIAICHSALVTVGDTVGSNSPAASILRTTQCPTKSLAYDDQRPSFPQTRHCVVSRRRPLPLKRCRQWREKISGRGERFHTGFVCVFSLASLTCYLTETRRNR